MSANDAAGAVRRPSGPGTPGGTPLGPKMIAVVASYLLLASALTLHVLIAVWPEEADGESTTSKPSEKEDAGRDGGVASDARPDARVTPAAPVARARDAGTSADAGAAAPGKTAEAKTNETKTDEGKTNKTKPKRAPREVTLLWIKVTVKPEILILLLVMASGALGGLVHGIRSFIWYVGNRFVYKSWTLRYLLQPLSASMLALLFYLVIRGGLFTWDSKGDQVNPFGFAAVACLIGMFSEQAALKLKEVAETIFTHSPRGSESLPQANGAPDAKSSGAPTAAPPAVPTIASVAPSIGVEDGGITVTIKGHGFAQGATVDFGGEAGTNVVLVDESTLHAVTPPHPAGAVDVKVTVAGQTATLPGAFEYR